MATVKDVPADAFIRAYAEHLKASDKIQLPEWVDLVKTGRHKELPPMDPDWYFTRAASVVRHIYMKQGIGVKTFGKIYCGKYRRGVRPVHVSTGSRGLIRHILHQLEKMKLVEGYTGSKGGRCLTSQGRRDLDLIAGRVAAEASNAL